MTFTSRIKAIPSDIQQTMISSGVWKPECPIPIERLRLLEVDHYAFEGNLQHGQMVVLDQIAERSLEIFSILLETKFPLHKIQLMDIYNGDDDASMEDNNSSCFNFRKISGTDELSIHSYGLAIDINPLQNPFLVGEKIYPSKGSEFLDRSNIRPGMIEPVVHLFKERGFEWGGDWTSPIDYHHFQIPPKDLGLV
ncbi:MAG: M15 family metallopeptidase [Pseudomonadota bacterium]